MYVKYEENGRIIYAGSIKPSGERVLVIDDVSMPELPRFISQFAVIDGVMKFIGLAPSQHHVFDYTTKQWIDPRTPETEWPLVRAERDRRLLACDWTQLPDVPLATKEAWATYRQALRDITLQSNPFSIAWPVAPG